MRSTALLSLLLLAGAAAAEEPPARPPEPLTPEQVADRVLEVIEARDEEALVAVAREDVPDPWLVADLLCYRDAHDAAEAFAKAAPRKAVEALPAYVAWRREAEAGGPTPADLDRLLNRHAGTGWQGVLDALSALPTPDDAMMQIRIESHRGHAFAKLRRLEEAFEVQRGAGDVALELGWLVMAGSCYRSAGMSAFFARNWESAVSAWQGLLGVQELLGDERAQIGTHYNIGSRLGVLGRYVEAVEHYERMLALGESLEDDRAMSFALPGLATLYTSLGRLEAALEYSLRALDHSASRGAQHDAILTLGNIGALYVSVGRYVEGLAAFQQCVELAEESDDPVARSTAHRSMGDVYVNMGQLEAALAAYERASKELGPEPEPTLAAILLQARAETCFDLGRDEEALSLFRRALELVPPDLVWRGIERAHTGIALLHWHRGRLPEALHHYRQALSVCERVGDPIGIAYCHGLIGLALAKQGDFAAALEEHEIERRTLEATPDASSQAWAWYRLRKGYTRLLQGENEKAAVLLRQAAAAVARLSVGLAEEEGASTRDRWSGFYELGMLAALRAGDVDGLAWFFEQGRAGTLREGLGSRRALQSAVVPPALNDRLATAIETVRRARAAYEAAHESRVLVQIREASKALESAQAEHQLVLARIQREAKASASLVFPEPDDLETLRIRLGPREAMIFYGLTHEEGVALIVRREGARAAALADSDTIREAVDGVLLDESPQVDLEGIPRLQELLVEPLELAPDVGRVLVSPTERMGFLPFALLFPEKEIAYVPSATTHGLLLEDRGGDGTGILGIGDPDYGAVVSDAIPGIHRGAAPHRLARLPATRQEVEAIAEFSVLGSAATESGVAEAIEQRERWRAVHFACHGHVDPERPMLSALALTPDAESDGFLTCLEIFRMRIPSDIVVLSACETGTGKIFKTEGIVGLTRAFMFAGSPRLICSLWKVDDEATRALMIKFYELWNPKDGGEGLGAAAALKAAQEYVRSHEKWEHPFYWAAWVLWGLPE